MSAVSLGKPSAVPSEYKKMCSLVSAIMYRLAPLASITVNIDTCTYECTSIIDT